ncbi:MAG: phosphoenolpyruvate-protein phosphotransferase [Pirellulaceae bacterium]|jgi:phosphoenolpyruvate-protein phosphotransferase
MILHGKCISPGVAKGRVIVAATRTPLLEAVSIPTLLSATAESERFHAAVGRAKAQLNGMRQQLVALGLTQDAAIFSAQASILADHSFSEQIESSIANDTLSAEAAVALVVLGLRTKFSNSPLAMVQDKAADILDIGQRILRCLIPVDYLESLSDGIVLAEEVTPSELVQFAHHGVRAIVTETCGMKSHTASLARGFGVPLVSGIELPIDMLQQAVEIVLDADAGLVVINPDQFEQNTVDGIVHRIRVSEEHPAAVREPISQDGIRATVLLNISGLMEAKVVSTLDADGVGLFRTEFLYHDYEQWPTEDECHTVYEQVASAIGDRELNIRLADFGAEKSPPYFDIPINRNPSLGIRGTRLLLGREDIFRPQVLAIERLARNRPLTVLLPMIDTLDTLEKTIQELCRFCHCRNRDQLPFKLGIMVEVPSAAYLIADLIEYVDSVSIGLNDLTQYMLASDRDDELVEVYHNPLQPAVLRIVGETIRVADANGKPVTMCGELAGDRDLACALLALGARRFSVSRSHYNKTVDLIRETSIGELQPIAEKLLQIRSGAAVREFLSQRFQEH